MQQLDMIGIILRLCLLNALMTYRSGAASAIHKYQYQNLIGGLYNASDDVVVLNATNFKTSVYGSNRSWLVEFYNSWCGFCYRFAPTWKALANDILPWNDIVVVAAIDCADDDNNPICREYEIMYYPMLKYFSVNARLPSFGITIEKEDTAEAVRHNLINRLEMEQQEGRGSTWPNIAPYRNVEITDTWKTVSSNVKFFFLVFETTDSHLGAEVILDLHRINSIQIRRVTSDNELLCVMSKVTKFPTLIVLGRNESQKAVNLRIPTREGIRRAIKDYVIARGVNTDEADTTGTTISQDNAENARVTVPSVKNRKEEEERRTDEQLEKNDDHLYQVDLESALHYSINREVSMTKLIDDRKISVLRHYLTVLAAYFPLRRSNAYLNVIRDVVGSKESMTGDEFSQLVRATEEEMSPVYSGPPRRWIGCKGSTKAYRGYPCGLWTLFHTLTVNFALDRGKDDSQKAGMVLQAMYEYIGTFFGCSNCASHFLTMASKSRMFDVRSRDEAVLWLWRAHNQVNARLAGDDTEDPEHKKIQYPAAEHCPACRFANGSWNEDEVLRYMKIKYSASNIKYDGINDNDSSNGNGNDAKVGPLAKETKRGAFGWDLNVFDISICVMLYITSTVIIVLVCVKFAMKRTYKKKSHVNVLGKA